MTGTNMSEPANANPEPAGGVASGLGPGRALVHAIVIAAVLLATVVLPAEYGIDPTGLGRAIGLTAMGERKKAEATGVAGEAKPGAVAKAAAPAPSAASDQHATTSAQPLRFDEIEVALAPNGEVEYKATLGEGEFMSYTWDAAGAKVMYDFHGEPAAGPAGAFQSFQKGTASTAGGSLRAPFAGTHGWWWKNPTQRGVVIKLRVSGFYSSIKPQ